MTNAERAQVFVDGAALPEGVSGISFTDGNVAAISVVGGNIWVNGLTPGSTDMTVTKAGRSGSLTVTVTAAPLVVTLGTPEPK